MEGEDSETLRFEDLLTGWYTDLRTLVKYNDRISSINEDKWLIIADEIAYWDERLTCFEFIMSLMKHKNVSKIIKYLKGSTSPFLMLYRNIINDLAEAIAESRGNLNWLQILKKPCMDLQNVESVDDIIFMLPGFFTKFIMIYEESEYYNEESHFDKLCNYLGNQILYLCRKTLDMNTILDSDVETSLDLIHKSLHCCELFIVVYIEFVNIYNSLNDKEHQIWMKAKNVYTFIARLQDLKYILNAKIIFKRLNVQNFEIPKSRFSFPPGVQFERQLATNEYSFDMIMNKLKESIVSIFVAAEDEWLYNMKTFQYDINNLCLITERITDRALKIACNEVEYVNILQNVHYFSDWPPLEPFFRKKTDKLYEFLIKDIEAMMQSYSEKKQRICYYMPKYSGVCIMASIQFSRITMLKKIIFGRPWLLTSSVADELQKVYDLYEVYHFQVTEDSFRNWWKRLDLDILNHLDNYIYAEDKTSKSQYVFKINVKDKVYNSMMEVQFWLLLGYKMPYTFLKFTNSSQDMLVVHKNSVFLIKYFSYIISNLSKMELLLFSQTLEKCYNVIQPLMTRYTWSQTNSVNNYLVKCYRVFELVLHIEEHYKQCNTLILNICNQIANTPLIPERFEEEIKNFKQTPNNLSNEMTMVNIIRNYNEIIRYVTIVYEGFEKHIRHIILYWEYYVHKIDSLIRESLILNVRWSLGNILAQRDEPIFLINIQLDQDKITYFPSLIKLVVCSVNSILEIGNALKIIPRLCQTFKMKYDFLPYSYSIVTDQACYHLQAAINETTKKVLIDIKGSIEKILVFSDIWLVNKTECLKKFISISPTADHFDTIITTYNEYLNEINGMRTEALVSCAIIRINIIKKQIIEHCQEWISIFSMLLLQKVEILIRGIHDYVNANTETIMKPPECLFEIIAYIDQHKHLILECDEKEEEMNSISTFVAVIEKHKIHMSNILYSMKRQLSETWQIYLDVLLKADIMLQEKKENFQEMVLREQEMLKREIKEFGKTWEEYKNSASNNNKLTSTNVLEELATMQTMYNEVIEKEKRVKADLSLFNLKYEKSQELRFIKEKLFYSEVFKLIEEWDNLWNIYKTVNFWVIEVSDLEMTVQSFHKKLTFTIKKLKDISWKIMLNTRDKIETFKNVLSLIIDLKNPAMRIRHWDEVRDVTQKYFDETDPNFTLEQIMQLQLQNYEEQISEISRKATLELNIENSIKLIKDTWAKTKLNIVLSGEEGVYRIQASDDILQILEDHLMQLHSMMGSKYISIYIKETDYWEKGLTLVMEVLEMTLSVQRKYIYSENIFKGDDVRKEIPNETAAYEALTEKWKKITSAMYAERNVFNSCNSKRLLKKLFAINKQLGDIQRALEIYMETKRRIFPRFYFISNDDLLDILVNANNPTLIQPHFKKCFDNINKIKFDEVGPNGIEDTAIGMYSADGEYVKWIYTVKCSGAVEYWFQNIEFVMRYTLQNELKNAMESLMKNLKSRDKWILKWPGQICITASQIQWTANCTQALFKSKSFGTRQPMKKIRKKQKKILFAFTDAIRGELTKVERLKIVSLVTIEVHARDVIDKMYKTNCLDVTDFQWMSQLRFYKKKDEILIRQTNTEQLYGYEYLGNSGRLAITPLTDRCYITLTTALYMFRGGSPKGPAGTGKTETVKDLGKSLAYYVIVINCSEGLDYKSMGHMFSGLVQQGAWGCFDEFNRINIEVLSVVAQQIQSIYSALSARNKSFIFEGQHIKLVPTCGIFITMNPGYAGRTELPDNLKSMFRAISMMVPDSKLIAEITLFGEGFKDTKSLANKVYVLFLLCQQQLSKQDHYEFGLRGLVSLLRYAGQCRRQNSNMADDEVLLLAMHNMNLAKLTVEDLPLFISITNDLFPNITLPMVKNEVLIHAIKRCMSKNNLQPSESAIAKIIQLYDTKMSRHSVMVLGITGSAKTTTWKTLRDTMTLLKREMVDSFETVIEYPLNPKALTLGELYGEYNKSTQEWMDGVLSSIMRKVCSDNGVEQKWILFDGPVDAIWIENMNSVMDDNKVLTLINSERITMPEQVSLLFEVEDLSMASPATVSRCGIVYNDYKDFGWVLYVDSWLNKCQFKPYKNIMDINFRKYLHNMLEFKKSNCIETVPLPELSSVQSLCKLLECFTFDNLAVKIPVGVDENDYEYLLKIWFLFCMVWSVCAVVNEDGRKKINNFLREAEKVFPMNDTVYHYYVDTNFIQFRHWDNLLRNNQWTYNPETPFFKMIVPTIDTIRYNYLVEGLMKMKQPVLLVGPVGAGKTSTIQKVLDVLDTKKNVLLIINMSARTSSNNIQETIEGRLEKRGKDLFVPQGNKTLVTFLDDLNMPAKEVYGAQPPLELIQQWMNYGFWYDRHNQSLMYIKNMLLLGAMGPPGGGRNTVSARLTSCFSMINLTFPEEPQITKIYSSMLYEHLKKFEEHIRSLLNKLTEMTISLYKSVVDYLLPTPAKIHYLFNLRDISKVFQGMLRSNIEHQKTREDMLKLWCNELFRVFNDKLINKNDRDWFMNQINVQLGRYFEFTYRGLCSSDRNPLFCNFLNKNLLYGEVTDENYLRDFITKSLYKYNSSAKVVPLDLVLFRDAIDHICRIIRVISQPRGYILLVGVGGSGRSSLAKVSNWLCGYTMFMIELTRSYNVSDFKEDLKHLYYQTGVKEQNTTFLFTDTQITNEIFLEIINNILSTGEVSKMYKDEEFEEIKNLLSGSARVAGLPETIDAIFPFFLDRVRNNLHIILCLSPIGNKFRERLRQYPSIVNCTTIDWFLDWPKEALLEVALKSLSTLDILATITGAPRVYNVEKVTLTETELRLCIANMFTIIHHSVVDNSNRMILELKRYSYVTPTNYLELVQRYKETLNIKRIEAANTANKLRNGLFKVDETSDKVAGMTVDLERATEIVLKYTEECDKFLLVISDQTSVADKQKKEVDEKSIKIREEEAISQKLYSLAAADFEKALPALKEALEALNALNKKDLAEVKSFSKPPSRVKLVLEAVMILKQVEPSWTEAKKQLGDPNFLLQLRDLDKDHIPGRVLKKIAIYTRNPEFEPEKVGIQSIAAKSLAMWVIAIEKYAIIYKIVAPKKESADAALISLQDKQMELITAQVKLEELQNLLSELKVTFDKKIAEKEQLIKKAEKLRKNLERAATLIEGLSGERTRWIKTVKQLDIEFDYFPGDCLLSIAFISYMGPFVSKYREILFKLWTESLRNMQIPNNPNFGIKDFLSDPAVIRGWNVHGLPNDDFSTENGIIISRCSRWPLVIDPQCQALKWIKNKEADNNLIVIDFYLPNYMNILETALRVGNPTLLQIVSGDLDPAIMPILSKSIIKQGNQLYIKMGDKLLPYNNNFRFFITTKLRNPYYSPEIFSRTTVINFAIKEEGLEDQLLDVVIRMEMPELKQLKDSLVINIAEGKNTLIELENELLRLLNEIQGSLLENEELFQALGSSKIISATVMEQLKSSLTTQEEIDYAREGYRSCAKRASILFFILNELNKIDPMYQFSLDSYMALFENSIKKSEKNQELHQRLFNMNLYHTYAVYQNTCRGLFEVHKLLFSFQICISLLIANNLITTGDIEFILKGGIVLNKETQIENPCPTWLPSSNWDNISELDKLPGFLGIEKSFVQFSREWKEWYMAPNPENLNLVGKWNENNNILKKLLFVKCLRLDRLSFAISNFVSEKLGRQFIETPEMDLLSALEDSSNRSPLIFLLSPGVNPINMITTLNATIGKDIHFETISLGQGQAPIATQLIKDGQRLGKWVFLANCHLSLSWMPKLDKIVDVMQDGKSHKDFRLWLSSNPNPDFPIAILQNSIKITTEPPKGLKANMKRLYNTITDVQFSKCTSPSKYKKLLFSLCFFHSVLIERKKFQNLGWNVVYSFNDSDFEMSENLLSTYLNQYDDVPWNTLKYLIAGICYGGHVTDDFDRRLLDTYITQYFNENTVLVPYYRLSPLMNYYIPRDGHLKSYMDYIETLPNVDNPDVFGQNTNAEMSSLMEMNRALCETLLVFQGQSSTVTEEYKEGKVLVLSSKILQKFPDQIDYTNTLKNIGTKKMPLDIVLLQEIVRYNNLLSKIKISLNDLRKGIKGLVVMSSDFEEVFKCIFEGRVPSQWLKAYPSLMPLGAWILDLIERFNYFTVWSNKLQPPVLFWLGAFTYPTSFLTAVLQIHSRNSSTPIDVLRWEFTQMLIPENDIIMPPQEGVYVRKLYLEGANWDFNNACLCEPHPLKFICELPIIQFKPVKTVSKNRDFYQCPVYYYPQRCGTQSRDSFVVVMNLNSGTQQPEHWIKRATAVLLNLSI